MIRVVQVIHHTLRKTKDESIPSSGWNQVLAEALARRSSEFQFECWGPDRFIREEEVWEGNSGIVHRIFPSIYFRYGVELSTVFLTRLGGKLDGKDTLLHLHGAFNLGTYSLATLAGLRAPIVVQFHDPLDDGGLTWSLRTGYRNLALSKVRKFLVPSEAMKRSLPRHFRDKTMVLPLGIDLTKFKVGNKDEAKRALNLEQNSSYCICVGRLIPSKGLQSLVRSVSILRRTLPDFHLILVGDGPLGRDLNDLVVKLGIKRNVTFAGHVEHSRLPTFYNAADLLIHPSTRDLAPMVVLESLACGTPVVASSTGYIPEVASNVGGVDLIASPTPESIAASTKSALAGEAGIREIDRMRIEEYGWDSLAPTYLNLYRMLCE